VRVRENKGREGKRERENEREIASKKEMENAHVC